MAKTARATRRATTAGGQTFTRSLTLPPNQAAQNLVFVVQAANGVGGVTLDTNGGQQYSVQLGDPPPPPTLATTLSLGLPPTHSLQLWRARG